MVVMESSLRVVRGGFTSFQVSLGQADTGGSSDRSYDGKVNSKYQHFDWL